LLVALWASLKNSTLDINGGDYSSAFTDLSNIDGSNLYVYNAGKLSLPLVTSFTSNGNVLRAYQPYYYGYGTLEPGTLSLSNLATITGSVNIDAAGKGSLIDLSALSSLGGGSLYVVQDGTVDEALTTISGTTVTLDGTGTVSISGWTSLTSSTLDIIGGNYAPTTNSPFAALSDIDKTNIYVYGGGDLSLPAVTSYTSNYNTLQTYQSSYYSTGTVGTLSLPALASITGPVNIDVQGQGSEIDIPLVRSLSGGNLSVTQAGTVKDGDLTTISGTTVTLDGTGTIATSGWTSLTNSTLDITGGNYASTASPPFVSLSDIDETNIHVYGGAVLSLPAVVSYTSNYNTLSGNYAYYYPASGPSGTLDLPSLTSITGNNLSVIATGQGSVVDMPALQSWDAPGSALTVTQNGAVNDNGLATLTQLTVTLDGTGVIPTAPWTDFTNSNLVITGGQYTFNLLRDLAGSSINLSNGASATLTALTTYTNPNGYDTTQWIVNGAGTSLSVPSLTGLGVDNSILQIQALQGGQILLPQLATIGIASPYVQIESDGTAGSGGSGSFIDLSSLISFAGNPSYALLQVTNGASVADPLLQSFSDVSLTLDPSSSFTLNPTLNYTVTNGASLTLQAGTIVETGSLTIPDNATITLKGSLEVDGSGVLVLTPRATLNLTGDLTGATTNAQKYTPLGTVVFDGGGGSGSPQHLEAMSADLGAVQAGFANNFAYGTISIASGTYLQLVDHVHNSTGTGSEVVYANELVVPSGATLDLNGLHMYVRGESVAGTIVNGTVTQVPGGGALEVGTPAASDLAAVGAVDNWAFFGRAGETVSIGVNPGGGGANPALYPQLGAVTVELLDQFGTVLAQGSSSNGSIVTLSGVTFTTDGVYTLRIAAPANSSNTGNYTVAVYDVTPHIQPLALGQPEVGTLTGAFGIDQWSFSATANEQVKFHLINFNYGSEVFNLTGPGGYSGFSNLTQDSGLITLPSSGTYTLSVVGTGGNGGSYAFELEQLTITPLTLGTIYQGAMAGSGQSDLYSVVVPSPQTLFVNLQDSGSGAVNQVYAKLGSPPTPADYDYSAIVPGSANQQLLVPSAAPGTWYFLVYGASAPSSSPYTIVATGAPVQLAAVSPGFSAYNAKATLTLTGAGFDQATSVTLIPAAGPSTQYPALSVSIDTLTQLTATFDLSKVPEGLYSVVVTRADGTTAELTGAFTVTAPGAGQLSTRLILPGVMGRHISSTIYIQYSNTGSQAIPAPILVLSAPNEVINGQTIVNLPLFTLNPALQVAGYWTSALPAGYSNTIEILASGKVPGVLEPGESVTVPVYYAGMQQPWNFVETHFDFSLLSYTQGDTTPVDWSGLASSLRPPGMPDAAWNAVFSGLTSQVGNTWAGFVKMMDENASYLGRLGENVTDVTRLWQFAIEQAAGLSPVGTLASSTDLALPSAGNLLQFTRDYVNSLVSRNTLGQLGYGWTDNWQYALSVAKDGTVTVTMPSGQQRVFQPDSRSTAYFSQPGDKGTLETLADGAFQILEANGTVESFNANGTLNFVQDASGNRVTAGYTSGQLTSLTASSGASITIAYNRNGMIASITGSDGREVLYGYDATGQYLTSVQGGDGSVTRYTYSIGSGLRTLGALTGIVNPDGTRQTFGYDTTGRLSVMASAGNSDRYTLSYSQGEVTVTDAAGDVRRYYYDGQGNLVKYVDPLGHITFATYDAQGDLTSVTGPTGLKQSFTYDANGNLLSQANPLGQTTSFTYTGSGSQPSSMVDPQGAVTGFQYNSQGNLTSVQYPDQSVMGATYDALGDPLSLTDPNGQVTNYTYNSAGQVLSATLADGTKMTYVYDSSGNLTSATDPSGTTGLTYDAAGRLTQVAYPGGATLQFSYDLDGRRSQMVVTNGKTTLETVNYSYNALGQLTGLTDGSGNALITYTYNVLGQLAKAVKGDGTSTIYAYDADGNVLSVTNDAAGGKTVDSSFIYTYDALGQVATLATNQGTWTYTYETTGQLAEAKFASINASVASQDITYSYNASGDRTQTVTNGATSTYTSNSDNEYSSITAPGGTTSYTYNANGDLVSASSGSGTTSYTYNSLNQLVGVQTPTDTWGYQYDALGNVIATTHNGQTIQDVVDPTGTGSLVAQLSSSGALQAGYAYGLGLVSQSTPTSTNYYEFDTLGSTAGLTTAGSTAGTSTELASYSYLPFGGLLSSSGGASNPFTFVGQYGVTSGAGGLDTMGARTYDPATGQFLTNDPTGLAGGDTNLRIYAGNSPLDLIDPSGDSGQAPGLQVPPTLEPGYGLALPSGYQSSTTTPAVIQQAASQSQSSLGAFGPQIQQYGQLPSAAERAAVLPPAPSFNFPVPLPVASSGKTSGGSSGRQPNTPGTPSGGQPGSAGGSSSPGSSSSGGSNGPNGTTTPSSTGYTGITQSGNTQTAGSGGLGSGAGVAGSAGSAGDGGNSGNSGNDGSDGSNGSAGSPGQNQYGPKAPKPTPPPTPTPSPTSIDPNASYGPAGYGSANFVSDSSLTVLPYRIDFENSSTATAPAQQVTITDQLDPSLNPATFQLTGIGWGDFNLSIPAGSQTYQTTVPMTYNGETFDVVVSAGINFATDQIYAKFYSLDPTTQLPPDVLTGFLPPENGTGRGQGYLSFSVSPDSGLATGTQIRNVAVISFDNQTTISTDQKNDEDPTQGVDPTKQDLITIDSVAPTSSVTPLPTTTSNPKIPVSWSGSDDKGGSGIAYYTIYVSIDGGPYKTWMQDTTQTSGTYDAGPGGHTYSFISQATDNVGNVEPMHTKADATIHVLPPLSVTSIAAVTPNPRNVQVSSVQATFSSAIDTSSFSASALGLTDNGSAVKLGGGLSIKLVSGTTYEIDGLGTYTAAEGSYAFTINAADLKDASGNAGSGTLTTNWLMDTTSPTSTVEPLPPTSTSTGITLKISASDPAGSGGSAASGVAKVDVFDAEDGSGKYTLLTTLTPTSPAASYSGQVAFTGQAGHSYAFYSIATDAAGNIQATPASAQATIQFLSPLAISSIETITPNPRNSAVSSVQVIFSEAVDTTSFSSAALGLTDNGTAVSLAGGLSLTSVSGTTYQVNGLSAYTSSEGNYVLTINAADLKDLSGNSGNGTISTSWLMDTTPPSSSVSALAKVGTSLSFPVTVTGTDPAGSNGSTPSGIADFTLDYSTNGNSGPWIQWKSPLPPSSTTGGISSATFTFVGHSNTVYSFYSTATDVAGNTQKSQPIIEAQTYLPDLTPPTASISSVSADANGRFTISVTGADQGGSVLTYFEVFAETGAGGFTQVGPAIPAGPADSSGKSTATTTFLSSAKYGVSNSYQFYAIAFDAGGQRGSSATAPIASLDNKTFTQPSALGVSGLTVEDGAVERSYIRYLTINFNEADPTDLQNMVNGTDITLTQNNLNNNGSSTAVTLTPSMMTVAAGSVTIDFGVAGLGGAANSPAANGYYTLKVTTPDGPTTSLNFYRLLGDVTGNGIVDAADISAIRNLIGKTTPSGFIPLNSDVNGDGLVNAIDELVATRQKGQHLAPTLQATLATAGVIVTSPAALPSPSWTAIPAGGFNLIQAITTAEQDGNTSDTINVPAGTYVVNNLTLQSLNSGVPKKTLEIVGQGTAANQVVITGGRTSRVFQVANSVKVVFNKIAIEDGKASDGGLVGGTAALGGGLLIDGGSVSLSHASVLNNSAVGIDGAAGKPAKTFGKAGGAGSKAANADGGGIYLASGTLKITDSTISGNVAQGGKGGKGGPGGGAGVAGANGSAGGGGAKGADGANGTGGNPGGVGVTGSSGVLGGAGGAPGVGGGGGGTSTTFSTTYNSTSGSGATGGKGSGGGKGSKGGQGGTGGAGGKGGAGGNGSGGGIYVANGTLTMTSTT
ncbi:MAG: RHS repeat-associated core domain-containing protein, partial [Isosphaeraceae bacterium]